MRLSRGLSPVRLVVRPIYVRLIQRSCGWGGIIYICCRRSLSRIADRGNGCCQEIIRDKHIYHSKFPDNERVNNSHCITHLCWGPLLLPLRTGLMTWDEHDHAAAPHARNAAIVLAGNGRPYCSAIDSCQRYGKYGYSPATGDAFDAGRLLLRTWGHKAQEDHDTLFPCWWRQWEARVRDDRACHECRGRVGACVNCDVSYQHKAHWMAIGGYTYRLPVMGRLMQGSAM